jgi:putative transposase
VLTVVDTFSRFSPALDARLSYRGEDVVQTLDRVCATIGYPRTIRVDQGGEFSSRDLDISAYARGVTLDFSRPGKPTDNAFAEAFNGRVRAERMNTHCRRPREVGCLAHYNEDRRHGSIGHKRRSRCRTPVTLPAVT